MRRIKSMVTEIAKTENTYQAAFPNVRVSSPTVPWLELVRTSAMERFEQLGFPAVHNEEWKYTNLATLAKQSFVPATRAETPSIDITRFAYPETSAAHLVIVNGFFPKNFRSGPDSKASLPLIC